jgi:hypothetical protein
MRPSLFVFPLSCAVLAVAAVVAFTSGGSASSTPAALTGQAAAATTVTQHLVLDSTDFVSRDNLCTLKVGNSHGISGSIFPGNCQDWGAGVHLPDDSTVTGIKVTYSDYAHTTDLYVALHERSLDGQSGSDVLSGTLPDPDNSDINFSSLTGDVPVDNHFDHYDLVMSLTDPGNIFYSAVVTYTVPTAAPANLNGDVDCNGTVDTMDDLALLKHQAGFADNPSCPIG